jgi:hypothetical protein
MNHKITAPPSTIEAAAVSQTYDIFRPVIKRMILHIPDGHKYLAHFQTRTKGKLIMPEYGSSDEWIEGNGHDIALNLPAPIVLDGPPYQITLRAWNEDDTYSHTFYLELE